MPACFSFVQPALLRPSRRHSEAMSWLAAGLTCDKLRDHYVDSKEGWADALLVLDCRPFLTFNDCHILSAVNVYCPSIVRRRARGRLPLSTVIPQADIREKLCRGHYLSVVVYDESSVNISSTTDDSMARLVVQCLKQDAGVKHPLFLEGGFQKFRQRYPYLCLGSEGPGPPPGFLADIARPRKNLESQREPVEILPHVYLGSAGHAADSACLRRLGITAVLNVSPGPPPSGCGSLAYKCIPVEDSGSADISFWFRDAIKFIEGVKSSRGKVLVHCLAGVSRSATICLAYLMHAQHLRLEDAYEFVKARRSIISPNFNFMGQLLRFEGQLFSSSQANSCSSSSSSSSGCTNSSTSSSSLAAAASPPTGSDDKCLKRAQRFVFDMNAEVPSPSTGGILTPLCTNTPIMSPS